MGVFLGGVPGVRAAHVVILGAGTVGSHAAQIAVGMGARVTVLNRGLDAELVIGSAVVVVVDGVVHYCVANMPGNVARTATFALNNATLPHALALTDKGWQQAMRDDPHLRNGLNVANGQVTCEAVPSNWATPTCLPTCHHASETYA